MAYARITSVTLVDGSMREVLDQVGRELLPVFRSAPGFLAYHGVMTAPDSGATVSVWETRAQADKSAATAGAWIRAHLGDRVVSVDTQIGEAVFSAAAELASA